MQASSLTGGKAGLCGGWHTLGGANTLPEDTACCRCLYALSEVITSWQVPAASHAEEPLKAKAQGIASKPRRPHGPTCTGHERTASEDS